VNLARPLRTIALISVLGISLLAPAGAQAVDPARDAAPAATHDVAPVAAPAGDPWVVSLGDSYISGEAGRWAGNESGGTSNIDALGQAAYWDAGSGESIARCHRSQSAAIHIGVAHSLNLACSGAVTRTKTTADGYFKPGIDFYDEGGRKGQALMLQEFAAEHNVKMVALSISGNDFKFAPIFEACVKAFLVPVLKPHCKDDATVQGYLSESAQQVVRGDTTTAILNVAKAMANAGYEDSEWTLVLQLYPQPLPASENIRYGSFGYSRQYVGGCGLRDGDLDWALGSVLPMINRTYRGAASDAQVQRPTLQIAVLDTSRAFSDRELCSKSVNRVGSQGGVNNWQVQGSADRSEWVMEVNIINARDTYQQESLHPNYWGQLALRNCYRQVWNGGDVQGGACERAAGGGVTADCEPRMALVAPGRSGVRAVSPQDRDGVRVNLRCPGIALAAGSSAVLKGRITPADSDVKVSYQVRWEGTAWRDRAAMKPTAMGSFRFVVPISEAAPVGRTYQWRVVATAGTEVVGVSQTRTSLVR
jgi:hypothetical protein